MIRAVNSRKRIRGILCHTERFRSLKSVDAAGFAGAREMMASVMAEAARRGETV